KRQACNKIEEVEYGTFYRRTQNELWTKGETSGNRLMVVSVATDGDRDSLLIRVQVEGEGVVCHEGTRSCFTRTIAIPMTENPHPTKTALDGAPAFLVESAEEIS